MCTRLESRSGGELLPSEVFVVRYVDKEVPEGSHLSSPLHPACFPNCWFCGPPNIWLHGSNNYAETIAHASHGSLPELPLRCLTPAAGYACFTDFPATYSLSTRAGPSGRWLMTPLLILPCRRSLPRPPTIIHGLVPIKKIFYPINSKWACYPD